MEQLDLTTKQQLLQSFCNLYTSLVDNFYTISFSFIYYKGNYSKNVGGFESLVNLIASDFDNLDYAVISAESKLDSNNITLNLSEKLLLNIFKNEERNTVLDIIKRRDIEQSLFEL